MEINEDDKKLLEMLGLENIPDQEKQTILEEIDQKMSERFIANLLTSLDDEASKKLQEELDAMPNDDPSAIIDKIIKTHPDAASILEKTSQEVMEGFKKAREKKLEEPSESQPTINLDNKPPIEQAAPKEPDMPSGSSLSNLGESELDKNIGEDEEDENMPSSVAPAPPTPVEKTAEEAGTEPKEEKPMDTFGSGVVKTDVLPTAAAEEKPLDVNFSPNSSNPVQEEKPVETSKPEAIDTPITPETQPVATPPAEIQEAEAPKPTEQMPEAPESTPPQEATEAIPSSPTDNPAPWSFSSTPASPEDQTKPQQDESPAAPITPEPQPAPETPQDNNPSPAPTPPAPPTNQANPPQSQASSIADLYQ